MAAIAVLAAACGGEDDGNTGEPAQAIEVAFAPNPAAPGAEPGPIRLVTLGGDRETREAGDPAYYDELAFSPDGRYLAAIGAGAPGDTPWVRIYEVASGNRVASDDRPATPAGIAWAPNGSLLAVVREGSVSFLAPRTEPRVFEGAGVAPGANPLRWAWTPDSEAFALVTDDGLVLLPLLADEGGASLPRGQFPAESDDWAIRTGTEPRELGLVDLRPVSGVAEGRAEYPLTFLDGALEPGEPRLVSIYDWNTLPSPEFDAATDRQFPLVRKTCSPCRSADGGSSLFVVWTVEGLATPAADLQTWPAGTRTLLAVEVGASEATALDLGIAPSGPVEVNAWQPVYDVVKTGE